jgi:hypothetical protein
MVPFRVFDLSSGASRTNYTARCENPKHDHRLDRLQTATHTRQLKTPKVICMTKDMLLLSLKRNISVTDRKV